MKKLIVSAALAATMLTAGAALAQDAPRQRFDPLAQADADKDGAISKAELLASVDQRFAKVDKNKDGKITADEREAMGKGMRGRMAKRAMKRRGMDGEMGGRMMGRADADGDGTVTLAEQRAQAERNFGFMDANKDGRIDQAERAAMRERMMAMRGPDGNRRGPPPPPPGAPDAPDGE